MNSTGKALIQVQRTLKRLVETGLVLKITQHKKSSYRADLKHVAFKDIKHLAIKAKIFSDTFEKEIAHLSKRVEYGFIYGSVAKGTSTFQSDVDILLIGELDYKDARSFMYKLGRELAQEVNVIIFSQKEFLKKLERENSFVTDVAKGQKIWLFGDEDEFEKMFREGIYRDTNTISGEQAKEIIREVKIFQKKVISWLKKHYSKL